MKNKNIKYILKDSLNTHISMHDNYDQVIDTISKFSKIFKNDTWSIYGGRCDDLPYLEDNALFRIPKEMQEDYSGNKFINFYFFKFDLNTNERLDLSKN